MSDVKQKLADLARAVETDLSGEEYAVNLIVEVLHRWMRLRDEARTVLAPFANAVHQAKLNAEQQQVGADMPRVVAQQQRAH